VRVIVNRRAACIHADGVSLMGMEFFHLLGQRVVKAQGHIRL
jgi:hypothetical protein